MSSREIAELTGKLHKNVLVDCDKLNESYQKLGMAEISAVNFRADNGQVYRQFDLSKMQTMDLMTGYSIELRIKVNRRWEELELAAQKATYKISYHLQRYMYNSDKIPIGYFCVLNELAITLIAPLEMVGYILPDRMVPDISEGKMFAGWVRREKGLEPRDFPSWTQDYPDGRKAWDVIMYPNALLGDFRDHFLKEWLPKKSFKYFQERDSEALPYLEKVVLKIAAHSGSEDYLNSFPSEFKNQLRSA